MPGISRAVCGILWCLTGAVVAEVASERPWPPWLPHVDIEDYECRKELPNPVVNWADLRQRFGDLVKQLLDERTLSPLSPLSPETRMTRIQSLQMELLEFAAVILWRFPVALNECPFGAVTASIFATCMAFMDQTELSNSPLKSPYDRFLNDLAQQSFLELVSRDLAVLLDLANLHVTAASEWATFALLHIYLPKIRGVKYSDPDQLKCAGVSVAGYKSERILEMLRRHIPYASGRDIEGLKFLRGLDPIVSATMKDPREFSTSFVQACPAGAAAFASASAMLALMSNPSLFERFSNLARWILRSYPTEALMGATTWTLFHAVAKLGNFALRSFDLVWSPDQLLNLPQDPHDFDRLRLDPALRVKHLEAAEGHQHPATRELASFLRNIKGIQQDPESMVYITAVGGVPFANYIQGFIQRALKVGLSALVIACMDSIALERCSQVVQDVKRSIAAMRCGRGSERFLCVPAMEGHVIFIKHAFLPVLLSAAVDTVWIDFDTFILQDPSPALRATRENPREVLPRRSRVRFGSFLFQNASDICNLSKICDKRQYMEVNVTSSMEESPLDYQGVELLVTEHWDARCLNNGLFYVRASYRTLIFFNLFLRQIYINPYTDNQNLFDAFLSHSTLDTAVPDARPLLRYALLDIDRQFGCAEGHASASATEDGLVTFHFWASDFRTREAAETEKGVSPASAGRIVARDGVERVEKVRAKKDELFEIFFSEAAQEEYSRGLLGIPSAGADFIAQVRAPQPNWRGMCSVTAVGVEDLVDERLLQGENQLIDWKAATNVMGADMSEVEREAAKDGDCEAKPRCEGIPLDEWALALQAIAQLGEAGGEGLSVAEVVVLKQRIRTLDVGTLLTVRAFNRYGPSRLAKELKELLEAEG